MSLDIKTDQGLVGNRGINPPDVEGRVYDGDPRAKGCELEGLRCELIELLFGDLLAVPPEIGHLHQTGEMFPQTSLHTARELTRHQAGLPFEIPTAGCHLLRIDPEEKAQAHRGGKNPRED